MQLQKEAGLLKMIYLTENELLIWHVKECFLKTRHQNKWNNFYIKVRQVVKKN